MSTSPPTDIATQQKRGRDAASDHEEVASAIKMQKVATENAKMQKVATENAKMQEVETENAKLRLLITELESQLAEVKQETQPKKANNFLSTEIRFFDDKSTDEVLTETFKKNVSASAYALLVKFNKQSSEADKALSNQFDLIWHDIKQLASSLHESMAETAKANENEAKAEKAAAAPGEQAAVVEAGAEKAAAAPGEQAAVAKANLHGLNEMQKFLDGRMKSTDMKMDVRLAFAGLVQQITKLSKKLESANNANALAGASNGASALLAKTYDELRTMVEKDWNVAKKTMRAEQKKRIWQNVVESTKNSETWMNYLRPSDHMPIRYEKWFVHNVMESVPDAVNILGQSISQDKDISKLINDVFVFLMGIPEVQDAHNNAILAFLKCAFDAGTLVALLQELTPKMINLLKINGFEVIDGPPQHPMKIGGCHGICAIVFVKNSDEIAKVEIFAALEYTANDKTRYSPCCAITLRNGNRIGVVSGHMPHHKKDMNKNTDAALAMLMHLIAQALKVTECDSLFIGADLNAHAQLVVPRLDFGCEWKITAFMRPRQSIILPTDASVDAGVMVTKATQ